MATKKSGKISGGPHHDGSIGHGPKRAGSKKGGKIAGGPKTSGGIGKAPKAYSKKTAKKR